MSENKKKSPFDKLEVVVLDHKNKKYDYLKVGLKAVVSRDVAEHLISKKLVKLA